MEVIKLHCLTVPEYRKGNKTSWAERPTVRMGEAWQDWIERPINQIVVFEMAGKQSNSVRARAALLSERSLRCRCLSDGPLTI